MKAEVMKGVLVKYVYRDINGKIFRIPIDGNKPSDEFKLSGKPLNIDLGFVDIGTCMPLTTNRFFITSCHKALASPEVINEPVKVTLEEAVMSMLGARYVEFQDISRTKLQIGGQLANGGHVSVAIVDILVGSMDSYFSTIVSQMCSYSLWDDLEGTLHIMEGSERMDTQRKTMVETKARYKYIDKVLKEIDDIDSTMGTCQLQHRDLVVCNNLILRHLRLLDVRLTYENIGELYAKAANEIIDRFYGGSDRISKHEASFSRGEVRNVNICKLTFTRNDRNSDYVEMVGDNGQDNPC